MTSFRIPKCYHTFRSKESKCNVCFHVRMRYIIKIYKKYVLHVFLFTVPFNRSEMIFFFTFNGGEQQIPTLQEIKPLLCTSRCGKGVITTPLDPKNTRSFIWIFEVRGSVTGRVGAPSIGST